MAMRFFFEAMRFADTRCALVNQFKNHGLIIYIEHSSKLS